MKLTQTYLSVLGDTLSQIARTQQQSIMQAARIVADTLAKDGLIHVFGCGHSHMLAEETFYRAGGLACVRPVFYEPLMLHEGAAQSSRLEKERGLAQKLVEQTPFAADDALICVSTSGINAVPVEFAAAVRRLGVPVIGISSYAYQNDAPRNGENAHLSRVCDVSINNFAPHGDACLQPEGLSVRMTPVSTVASTFIVNSILAEAAQLATDMGVDVPVYQSGNIPGGAAYNEALIQRYQARISCL